MTDPKITVLLNTARGDYPMIGRPDTWIFDPTLESLAAQTFRDFEVVIVDAMAAKRKIPREHAVRPRKLGSTMDVDVAVGGWPWFRLLSFPDSPWYRAGYIAISAPKNHGIVHANGEMVVQLDDCCSFGPDFLARYWDAHRRGFLSTPVLHYHRGGEFAQTGGREHAIHPRRRYAFLDGAYGYSSFRLADALRINGYDEGFDGSKCLEDAGFSTRMRLLGRRYRIDREHLVIEHQHGDVSQRAWPVPPPEPKGDRSIKCNAIHDQIVRRRDGEDRLQANRRQYSDAEWATFGPPCRHYAGGGLCSLSRLDCNWFKVPGDPESGTWIGADPNWEHIRDWQPVFDLAERWRARRRADGRSEDIPGA